MRGEAGRGAGRGGRSPCGGGSGSASPPASQQRVFFPRNFSAPTPRGPGGRQRGESALTHAQLRASGWMPRPAPHGAWLGGAPGLGKVTVPTVVIEGASLV